MSTEKPTEHSEEDDGGHQRLVDVALAGRRGDQQIARDQDADHEAVDRHLVLEIGPVRAAGP